MIQGTLWKTAPGRHSHCENLKSSYQSDLELEVGPNMEGGGDDIKASLTVTQTLKRDREEAQGFGKATWVHIMEGPEYQI